MEKKNERKALGRGLSALMADVGADVSMTDPQRSKAPELMVRISEIHPNPDQPRRSFDPRALQELSDSIVQKGIIQPLILRRRSSSEGYEIVAGERRWRAAQMAQLHQVPAIVRDYSDLEVLEIAIVENIQRSDLNPIEEAEAYVQLMDRFGHTQEMIAQALGRSRSHISNSIRLLSLPPSVLELLRSGQITAGHARPLINSNQAGDIARQVVQKGLSVREVERLVKRPPKENSAEKRGQIHEGSDADTRALETELTAHIGMLVRIEHAPGAEGGKLSITYRNLDQLDLLCATLSVMTPDVSR